MNCWKASVLIKLIPTFIICLSPDGDWIRENGYLDVSLFCKDKLHHCQSKEKSVFSKKKNTNAKNIEKRQPFFNTNDFQPLPSKPNTNASKQDYSRIINVSPRNYNTHSTSATTETSFPQQQLFHLSRLKHNPIQHQRQSN